MDGSNVQTKSWFQVGSGFSEPQASLLFWSKPSHWIPLHLWKTDSPDHDPRSRHCSRTSLSASRPWKIAALSPLVTQLGTGKSPKLISIFWYTELPGDVCCHVCLAEGIHPIFSIKSTCLGKKKSPFLDHFPSPPWIFVHWSVRKLPFSAGLGLRRLVGPHRPPGSRPFHYPVHSSAPGNHGLYQNLVLQNCCKLCRFIDYYSWDILGLPQNNSLNQVATWGISQKKWSTLLSYLESILIVRVLYIYIYIC